MTHWVCEVIHSFLCEFTVRVRVGRRWGDHVKEEKWKVLIHPLDGDWNESTRWRGVKFSQVKKLLWHWWGNEGRVGMLVEAQVNPSGSLCFVASHKLWFDWSPPPWNNLNWLWWWFCNRFVCWWWSSNFLGTLSFFCCRPQFVYYLRLLLLGNYSRWNVSVTRSDQLKITDCDCLLRTLRAAD